MAIKLTPLNIIMVFSPDETQVLMCLRRKPPFQGLLNFVGGKVEKGETSEKAAYRELEEETGISDSMTRLVHMMNLQYLIPGWDLQVFVGKLRRNVVLREELNHLYWIDVHDDFCDQTRFAGECNIRHLMEHVRVYHNQLLE